MHFDHLLHIPTWIGQDTGEDLIPTKTSTMSPLARTPAAAASFMLRAAFTAGPSSTTAIPSRILPMLAGAASSASKTRAFSSSSRALDSKASGGGDVERLSTTSQSLYGSAAKATQASPSSLVGGRVGVIAPSQALTEDWAIQHDYPDYSKGPSALDKASRLFFFSEILRGMWVV